ncbi:hypothetical protein BDN67DRAFT_900257 [Paxillus ammoniavirescens]|nr:hypothetical protein BDN67DRAFT_900257 [Paxillus ammoniavirescens]
MDLHVHAPAQQPDPSHWLPPSNIYTLPELRLLIDQWHTDWDLEAEWERNFHLNLRMAQEDGRSNTDLFFHGIEAHAIEGRRILRALRHVARGLCKGARKCDEDAHLQVFDLGVAIMSEIKFFEVKLQEYTPSILSSKVSNSHTYYVL